MAAEYLAQRPSEHALAGPLVSARDERGLGEQSGVLYGPCAPAQDVVSIVAAPLCQNFPNVVPHSFPSTGRRRHSPTLPQIIVAVLQHFWFVGPQLHLLIRPPLRPPQPVRPELGVVLVFLVAPLQMLDLLYGNILVSKAFGETLERLERRHPHLGVDLTIFP